MHEPSAPDQPAPPCGPPASAREHDLYRALARALYLASGVVLLFWLLDEILLGIIFGVTAVLLATALNPPVTWMEDRGVPRFVAALGVCSAIFTVFLLLAALVVPPVARDVGILVRNMPMYLTALEAWALDRLEPFPKLQNEVRELRFEAVAEQAIQGMGEALTGAGIVSLSLIGLTLFCVFLSVTVLFILAHPRPLIRGALMALPERLREPSARALARGSDLVSRWLLSNLIVGTLEGVAAGAFLTVMGVPGGILWGVFTFFSEQVPKLGPYIMSVPPVIVAFVVSPMKGLWVLLFYFFINQFTGFFIGPLIRSQQMKLHPASLIFSVLIMAGAFGILGALIATPLAGVIKAFYEEFYLSRQPDDPRVDGQVERILRRQSGPGVPLPEGSEAGAADATARPSVEGRKVRGAEG